MGIINRHLPEGIHDYFITARCANRDWFRLPLAEVWDVFQDQLHFLHIAFGGQTRAAVLMANHYHMILTIDSDALSTAMCRMQSAMARELNRRTDRLNQVWGRRYHSAVITTHVHFCNVYKYLYRNPVRAGVCDRAEEYKHSALRGLLGLTPLHAPIFDPILFQDLEERLRWLSLPSPHKEDLEAIRTGLKRSRFQLTRNSGGHLHHLNFEAP